MADIKLIPGRQFVQYRWVVGYEGRYAVGDDGSAWSCCFRRKADCQEQWRELKQAKQSTGYLTVSLTFGKERGGKFKTSSVHCLVLESFVGPAKDGQECRHINGVRDDNRLTNIAWGTHLENERDKLLHGTIRLGEMAFNSILSDKVVSDFRRRYATGENTIKELASECGTSLTAVHAAISGKSWSHVEEKVCVPTDRRGESNGNSKLSWSDAREIRRRCQAGEHQTVVARDYGVSATTVWNIVRGNTWKE